MGKNVWEEFFDGHAPEYMNNVFTKNTKAEVDFLIEELNLAKGSSILDIGCGTGVMAHQEQAMVGPRGSVLAIDPSLAMLQVARGRGIRQLVAGRAERIPLTDCSVDFISLGHALRHTADQALAAPATAAASRESEGPTVSTTTRRGANLMPSALKASQTCSRTCPVTLAAPASGC